MKSIVPSNSNQNSFSQGIQKGDFELNFQKVYEESPVGFYSCDIKGHLKYFNKAAVKLWGTTPEKDKPLWAASWKVYYPDGTLMPPEDFPLVKALQQNFPSDSREIILERPDNSRKRLLVFPQPIYNAEQQLVGANNTLIDVTPQQNWQLKQATLSAIVESSDDAIVSKDLNGIITSWNYGAQKIFGYTEEEVVGKSITILIPKDRLKEEELIINNIRSGKRVKHFETFRKTKEDKIVPISLTVSPIKDIWGNIIGASKIARDISVEIKAQKEIKKYTRNLEILNSIGKSISEDLDVQAVLQRVTDATTKLTGAAFGAFFYNTTNEKGDSFRLFSLSGAPRDSFEKLGMPRHTSLFQPTFAGKEVVRVDDITEDERYGKNFPNSGMPMGHFRVVSYLAVPVVSKSGVVIGGLLFGHPEKGIFKAEHEEMVVNIAAQAAISLDNSKLFEQVKSFSDKKDEFIALASHELKTPLTTIKGYLQVLSKKEKDQMSELFLDKSLYQVDKLNTLVDDLLHMSRVEAGKVEYNIESFDIREMLQDVVETFSYSNKTHKLIYDLGENPALIEGDKQRIEQAIINLMNNAVKYSPEADKVMLELKVKNGEVEVRIKDEGMGLSKEQQSQLFTRFYRAESTKGISGLGLGLYLTKQIIDRHNGSIGLESVLGEGSDFFFTLPLKETAEVNS